MQFLQVLVWPKAGTNAPKLGVFSYFSLSVGRASAILKEARMLEKLKFPSYFVTCRLGESNGIILFKFS